MKKINLNATARLYGIYLGVFLFLYGVIFRIANFHYTSIWAWVFYLAIPIAILTGVFNYNKKEPFSFKKTMKFGIILSSLGSFIYSVYVYLYNQFLDDSLLQAVREDTLQSYEGRGLTNEQMQLVIDQIDLQMHPAFFSFFVFIRLGIIGILSSLILALFFRFKNRSNT